MINHLLPKFYLDVKPLSSREKNTTNTYESLGLWNSFSDSVARNLEDDFHFILNNRKRLRLPDRRSELRHCPQFLPLERLSNGDVRESSKMVRYIVHSAAAWSCFTQRLWTGEQQCSDLSYCMFGKIGENVLTVLTYSFYLSYRYCYYIEVI
jgi:hypothetical protein